jgi:hypothetical protein
MHTDTRTGLGVAAAHQLELFTATDQPSRGVTALRVSDHLAPFELPAHLTKRLPLLTHFVDRVWSVSRPIVGSFTIKHITFVRTFWEFESTDIMFFLMCDGTVRTTRWIDKSKDAETRHTLERLLSKEAHPDLIRCLAEHFVRAAILASNFEVAEALHEIRQRHVRRLRAIRNLASTDPNSDTDKLALQHDVTTAAARHSALSAAEMHALRAWTAYHVSLLQPLLVAGATKRRVFSLAAYNALASVDGDRQEHLAQALSQNYSLVTASLAAAQQPRQRLEYRPHWVGTINDAVALPSGASLRRLAGCALPAKKSVVKYLAAIAYGEVGTRSIDRLASYLDAIPHAHWPPAHKAGIALLMAQEARTFETMLSEFAQREPAAELLLGDVFRRGLESNAEKLFKQRWTMSAQDRKLIGVCGKPSERGQLKNESFAQRFLLAITSAGLAYEAVIGILSRVCRMPALSRCQLFKAVDALASNEQKHIGGCVMGFDMSQDFFGDIESVYRNAQADMEPEQKFPTPYAGGSFRAGAGMYTVKPVSTQTDIQALALEFANCLGRDEEFSKVASLQVSLWVIRKKHPIESTQSSMADKSILALQIDTTADEAGQKQYKFVLTQIHGPRNCAVTPEHSKIADQLIALLNQEPEKARRFLKAKLEVQLKFLHWMRTSAAGFSRCQLIRLIKNHSAYPLCTTKDG